MKANAALSCAFTLCLIAVVSCASRPDSRISPYQRFQLLKGACSSGDERSVSILLESGADPYGWRDWETEAIGGLYGDEFTSPLSLAALNGHVEIMRLLFSHGAEVDVLEGEGYTPLSLAVGACQRDSVAFLLAKGADPKRRWVQQALSRCDDPEIQRMVSEAKERIQPNQALQTTPMTRSEI